MAKKKTEKPETKSEFLRKVLDKKPDLNNRQINQKWTRAEHDGTISDALFYQVRAKMGIKIVRQWMFDPRHAARNMFDLVEAIGLAKLPPSKTTRTVYQLKITLKDVQPPVWRRLLVPDCPLSSLHEIIQVAMGWQNSHLHSFRFGQENYTDPRVAAELDMEDEDRVNLADVIKNEKFKFEYSYDFGDDWRHEIRVEKIQTPEVDRKYAGCLEGKRACPLKDIGGP